MTGDMVLMKNIRLAFTGLLPREFKRGRMLINAVFWTMNKPVPKSD